jgi:hypothetical protein
MDCCDDNLWRSLQHMGMGRSGSIYSQMYECTDHILWRRHECMGRSGDVSDIQHFVQLMAGTTPLDTTSLR